MNAFGRMRTRSGRVVLLGAFGLAVTACASLWSFQDFQQGVEGGEDADAADDVSVPADAVADATLDASRLEDADADAERLDAALRDATDARADATDAGDAMDAMDAADVADAADASEAGVPDAKVCASGFHPCEGVCSSDFSPNSCGPLSCAPCALPVNGLQVLCNGTACVGSCTSSLTLCDGGAATGQCVDPTTDPGHCGGCNTACPTPGPGGVATCTASTCGIACNPGLTACPPRDAGQPASCVDGGCP
jgi:hypothetical protein